jgi:NAD dependent epimerase/dehydratase family enzyme
MRVTVTGATGLLGKTLVGRLRARGAEVTVLSRDPERALASLRAAPGHVTGEQATDEQAASEQSPPAPALQAFDWNPLSEPAPPEALAGRDAVVHLAGENVAQRWTADAKSAIYESRTRGTAHLLDGLRAVAESSVARGDATRRELGAGELGGGGAGTGATDRDGLPRVLVSSSAIGYYGPHGPEPLDEEAPAGSDFLAGVCVAWEAAAQAATELGLRVVQVRTGVVLDRRGGALAKMLLPFRLGIGGPVAGGAQYMSWIHRDDLVGMMLTALEDESWSGPVNATAPEPLTNREFSKVLGAVLHRPSLLPVPAIALRALYGDMAEIVTTGARVMPAKPLMLGYRFEHPKLKAALEDALA